VVAGALRCLAHANGAHLVYLGGLQPGGGAGAEGARSAAGGGGGGKSAVDRSQVAALDNFTRMIQHLAFVGMEKSM
jgi:hypothetical protein